MADKKISQLTGATTPLAGTEVVPLVQSSTTKKVAVSDLTAGRDVAAKSLTADDVFVNNNVVISTAGKGIDFSATTSGSGIMTSELLADYEEGTWSPTFDSETAGTDRVTSVLSGTYVKVGRIVCARAYMTLTTLGSGGAGDFVIRGLPFSITGNGAGVVGYFGSLNANVNWIGLYVPAGTSYVKFIGTTGAAATATGLSFATYAKVNTEAAIEITYVSSS